MARVTSGMWDPTGASRPRTATVWEADGSPHPGATHGQDIARRLRACGFSVSVVPLPQRMPDGEEMAASLHVLSGGTTSATTTSGWVAEAGARLDDVLHAALAGAGDVAGICFGAQLIAVRLAGVDAVRPSPAGLEVGLETVRSTATGVQHVVAELHHHEVHPDAVGAMGATTTFTNDHSPVQGFAVGPRVRCYQFHPELDPTAMAATIRSQGDLLRSFGRSSREAMRRVRRRSPAWQSAAFEEFVLGVASMPAPAAA